MKSNAFYFKFLIFILVLFMTLTVCTQRSSDESITDLQKPRRVLPEREQARLMNSWLDWK